MEYVREEGVYINGRPVRLVGSFQTNGAGAVTIVRDGHSFAIATVARISAGLFEVTFDQGYPIPERCVFEHCWGTPLAAQTTVGKWDVVANSYNSSTRKIRFQFVRIGAIAAPTTLALSIGVDPDVGERVNFELIGSISSSGTDLA